MLCCMKNAWGTAAVVGISLLVGAAGSHLVASPSGAQPEGEMSMEQMMEAMKQASMPGEHHEALAPLVGEWEVEAAFTMPDGQEMTSTGRAENQWLLGDRFVGQHYEGPFMGMDFEGYGAIGYHKEKGEYVSVWMDNFGTGMLIESGKPGTDPKTITTEGSYQSMMGEQKMRHVTRIISNDKHVLEFHEPGPDGQMRKTGTLTYTRVK